MWKMIGYDFSFKQNDVEFTGNFYYFKSMQKWYLELNLGKAKDQISEDFFNEKYQELKDELHELCVDDLQFDPLYENDR